MKARLEHRLLLQEKNFKFLEGKPSYLKGFYYSLTNLEETSKREYIQNVNSYIEYLNNPEEIDIPEVITYDAFNKYVVLQKNCSDKLSRTSTASLELKICSIKRFHNYLFSKRILNYDFWSTTKIPKKSNEKKPITCLSSDETAIILNNIKEGAGTQRSKAGQKKWQQRDRLLFLLPLLTGIRVTALSEINLEDLDLKERLIHVTEKENIDKKIYLTNKLIDEINDWLIVRGEILNGEPCDALFVTKYGGGKRIHTNSVREIVKKYTSNIDKSITPHKLRSTFGNSVYQTTGDIYKASVALGHANVETTQKHYVDPGISGEEVINIVSKIEMEIGI